MVMCVRGYKRFDGLYDMIVKVATVGNPGMHMPTLLGALFVLVTLLLPRGIVGSFRYWTSQRRERKAVAAANETAENSPSAVPRAAE